MTVSVILRLVASAGLGGAILWLRHKRRASHTVPASSLTQLAKEAGTRQAVAAGPPRPAPAARVALVRGSPLEALASRANMLRWVTHEADMSGRRRNRLDVAGHLAKLLDVPVTASARRGDEVSDGLMRFDGQVLMFRVTHGAPLVGTVQVFFRGHGSQVRFLTTVEQVGGGTATLSIPTSLEQFDCRGAERRSLVEGRQQLGLTFLPEGREHTFMVLDVSATGVSLLIVGRDAVPAQGDRLTGSLVFEGDELVKVAMDVRHVTSSLEGTRVGLKLQSTTRDTRYSLDEVAGALAA